MKINYIKLSNSELLLLHLMIEREVKEGRVGGTHKIDLDAIAQKVKNAIQNLDEGETYEN